jgi:hypothetical protein
VTGSCEHGDYPSCSAKNLVKWGALAFKFGMVAPNIFVSFEYGIYFIDHSDT